MTRHRRTVALLDALHLVSLSPGRVDTLLTRLAQQTPDRALRSMLTQVGGALGNGATLEQALDGLGNGVDAAALAVVAAGARHDGLAASIDRARFQLDSREHTRALVRGVVLRPALVVAICVLLWAIAGPLVLPEIATLSRDVWSADGAPLSARVAITFADRPLLLPGAISLALGLIATAQLGRRVPAWDRLLAHAMFSLPIVGPLEAKRVSALVASLATPLTHASISTPEVITLLSRLVDNRFIASTYKSRIVAAERGELLSTLLCIDGIAPFATTSVLSDVAGVLAEAERRSILPAALDHLTARLVDQLQQAGEHASVTLQVCAVGLATVAVGLFVWVFHMPIVLASGAMP